MQTLVLGSVLFLSVQATAASECSQNWSATQNKISRLGGVADCMDFGNLEGCRVNAGIMSPIEKVSAVALGARLAAAATVAGVKCGGQTVASRDFENEYPFAFQLLFGEPSFAAGGCIRAASVFANECAAAGTRSVEAIKQLERDRAIKIWAQQNNISDAQLAEWNAKYVKEGGLFTAFEGKKDTLLQRVGGVKSLNMSAAASAGSDIKLGQFFNFYRNDGFVNLTDPVIKQLETSRKSVLSALEEINNRISTMNSSGATYTAEKASAAMQKISSVMNSLKASFGSEQVVRDTSTITKSLSESLSTVCSSSRSNPSWMHALLPEAQAGASCLLRPTAIAAADGVEAGATDAALRVAGRMVLRKMVTGANVLAAADTVYELGKLGYNKMNPCPAQKNIYLIGTQASDGCAPEMSIGSLKQTTLAKNSTQQSSFFDLPEASQKAQLDDPQFCSLFNKVYKDKLGNKTAICKKGSVVISDRYTRITHQIILGADQKVTEVRSYGEGMPYGSAIVDLGSDEQVTSFSTFSETRANPTTQNPTRTGIWNFQNPSAQPMGEQAQATLGAMTGDMSAILEKVGCCTGTLSASDSEGRCQGVTFPDGSTGLQAAPDSGAR